jgi:hypothetical protein
MPIGYMGSVAYGAGRFVAVGMMLDEWEDDYDTDDGKIAYSNVQE